MRQNPVCSFGGLWNRCAGAASGRCLAWNALQGSWWVGARCGQGLASWWGKVGAVGKILGQELRLEVGRMNIGSSARSWTSPCGEMFLFCNRIRWKSIGFWSNYIQV